MYNYNHHRQLQRQHPPKPKPYQNSNNRMIPHLQQVSRNGSNNNALNCNDRSNKNSIHQTGLYQLQSKRISVPVTITNNSNNTNNNNRATIAIQRDIQKQLQRHNNCCFITIKPITVKGIKVPSGHVGKVVLSREVMGKYCCVFGLPYGDIEAAVNPATYLKFGVYHHTYLYYIIIDV